ncbi:MAG: tol-pal system protein YbgF [Gammaproteobacteria bacterium]|nr:tol-pal system protein YbgF [Gammaproteobacteria bacterium]MDH5591475.1 tol-pal system protein YbgF [Gammaproteobacteria bacterium]
MKVIGRKALVLALLLSPMMTNSVWADEAELSQRIERLERIIQGQGLVSLLGRVDQLQNEIQRLNGDNESLRHELEVMQKRQREMYLDIDQRMQAQTVAVQQPASEPETDTEQVEVEESPSAVTENTTETPEQSVAVVENAENIQPSPVAVENGEAAYQAALQTLRSGQYEQAIVALEKFPEQFPQSSYLPNAYYWQGEANYVLRNFDVAITAFQTVIDRFPSSTKVADAMLKQGFSQYELGQLDVAKTTLAAVVQKYANSSAARLAKVRLARIKQEAR